MDNNSSFETSPLHNTNLNNSINSSGTIQNIPHSHPSSPSPSSQEAFSSNLDKLLSFLTNHSTHSSSVSYPNTQIASLLKTKNDLLKEIQRNESQSSLQSLNNNFHKSKNQSEYINKSNYNTNSYYSKQSKEKSDFNNLEYSEKKLFRYCDSNKRLEMEFYEKADFIEKLEFLFKKHMYELKHLLDSNEDEMPTVNYYRKEQHKRYHHTTSNQIKIEANKTNVYEDWTVSVSEDNTNNNSIDTKITSARDDDQNSNDSRDNTNINSGSDILELHCQVIGINGRSEINSTRMKKSQYRMNQMKNQKQMFENKKMCYFNHKLKYNNYGTNTNNGFHKKTIGKNTNK